MRLFCFLLIFVVFTSPLYADNDIWLLIDTKNLLLKVKQGDETLDVFNNIAIGRGGAGEKNKAGDDITPLGNYKIAWVNYDSPYQVFYGFDYPSIENARNALQRGLINKPVFDSIVRAHKNGQVPPQNTPLGGQIGLHGLGRGDVRIHLMTNWTHGCIALTNKQIERLGRWIEKGTVVVIR